jgi:hypothetical protein
VAVGGVSGELISRVNEVDAGMIRCWIRIEFDRRNVVLIDEARSVSSSAAINTKSLFVASSSVRSGVRAAPRRTSYRSLRSVEDEDDFLFLLFFFAFIRVSSTRR